MAHAAEKIKSGREPTWIVELDLDYCQESYGVAPCTAAGAAGTECFNTRKTCQDATNYNRGTLTYRFCEPRSRIPVTLNAIPCLRSVTIAPTKLTVGKGLGQRASVSCAFQDFPHHDRGVDPYVGNRTYTPEEQGTYWKKLRVRNLYYQGREMRIKSGYVGDPFDLVNDFVTRTYFIEKIEGPDASGRVTVTGKDILKLADDDRAQAPNANTGYLAANINAGAGAATLAPAGIGNTEYSAAGTIRIGEECITFTRVADALTLTARGTDGTTAAAHDANDSVQECLRYTSQEIDDVLTDLLVNYASVPAGYIIAADWQTEVDDWLSGHTATALIVEPTGVKKLISEICEQFMCDIWWDERDSEVKIAVLSPHTGALTDLSDAANLVADSVNVSDEPKDRITQVWVYYGVVNPVEGIKEAKHFTTLYVLVEADAETADEYGDKHIKTIHSRWLTSSGDVLRLASRTLSRFRDNPRTLSFRLDGKDTTFWTGSKNAALLSDKLEDATGLAVQTPIYITETREVMGGHAFEYKAIESIFRYRYGHISPNGTPVYTAATAEQRLRYGFISANAAPYFADETEYYALI